MDLLLDHLAARSEGAPGTVIYIGAGDGRLLDVERWKARMPRRLILVEGDPDAAAALARRVAPLRGVEVRRHAVASAAGPLRWHRYSWSALNGPLDSAGLAAHYPRLRPVETTSVPASTLAGLLEGIEQGANVLLLDVPGQEDALLAQLTRTQIAAFDIVCMRGCRLALPGGAAADAAVERLVQAVHQVVATDESQPLWPTTLLRFSPERDEMLRLRDRVAALEEEKLASEQRLLSEMTAERAARATERAALRERCDELERNARELERARERAEEASEAHAGQLTQLRARHDALTSQCAELENALARRGDECVALQQTVSSLNEKLVAEQRLLSDVTAERAARAKEGADLRERCDELRVVCEGERARANAAQQAYESHAVQLTKLQARHAALTGQCVELENALVSRSNESASLQQTASSLKERVAKLENMARAQEDAAKNALQAGADRERGLQVALREEREAHAEQQAALVADNQALQHSLASLEDGLAASRSDVETLQQEKLALERALAKQRAQLGRLAPRVVGPETAMASAGDVEGLRSRLAEAESRCVAAQQQAARLEVLVERLEAARDMQSGRQQKLHEERLRAEGQLELVKDLLLREPGL
jgi:hypothetical protein